MPGYSRGMTRNKKSAMAAGARFEREVADYLAATVDDRIDRRRANGVKDRGDIGAVRAPGGGRVVVQCKDYATPRLGTWAGDVEIQRGNDDAMVGVIVHKRHGKGPAGDQWVTMTLRDLAALLSGERPA